ncbi:DUF3320 domain-containing protein [Rhodococcus pyridinivorans]|uniref:DUF3320 domain-containing protein n=1 Tax=Rhodococcus pyridinivorans TaxID=103816 RepID=UPI003AB034EE
MLADLSFSKGEPEQLLVPSTGLEERHELVAGAATTSTPTIHFDEEVAPSSLERDWHGRGVAYACAPTTPLGDREDLDRVNSASVRRVITDAVRETVEIEGPILLERLARDVARRFGFDRVSAARREFVVDCVPTELISTTPLGTFVWPRQINKADWRGFRTTPDDVTRPSAISHRRRSSMRCVSRVRAESSASRRSSEKRSPSSTSVAWRDRRVSVWKSA